MISVEVLSRASLVTRNAVFFGWLIPSFGLVAVGTHLVRRRAETKLPRPQFVLRPQESFLLIGILVVLLLTALVAWYSPPQTWDSLNYHVARVAHWAQQATVAHFATGIEVQNSRPPAAEFMVLHIYLLGGGDKFVNFVQWTAMLLSMTGASLLSGQLGAGQRGQLLSAVFVVSLPMGIVQASSSSTDYLVALWCLAAASETLTIRERGSEPVSLLFLGLASGLALATKPTAVAYLAPFGAYTAYLLIRRHRIPAAVLRATAPALLIALLNAGYLARNLSTYGSLNDPSQVAIHSNQLRNLRGVVSNLVRHLGLQAGTPSPHINKGLTLAVLWIHQTMKLDVNDLRTTAHGEFSIGPPTTNEDRAGNPLHAYLMLALLGYAALRRNTVPELQWLYATLLVLSLLTLSYLFKWQIFAGRYHLPFFVLAGGLAACLLEQAVGEKWLPAVAAGLLVGSIPWLLQIKSRPLIANEGRTYVDSILHEPREELYLANGLDLLDPYLVLTGLIREAGCQAVGIALSGNSAEYPIWAFLGAPGSGVEIQWIVSGTPSAQYRAPNFKPCAVVCEGCPEDQVELRGLPLVEARGNFRLYLGSSEGTG